MKSEPTRSAATPITVTTRPLSLVVMDYGKVTFS